MNAHARQRLSALILLAPLILVLQLGCGSNSSTAHQASTDKAYMLRLKPTAGPIAYEVVIDMTADTSKVRDPGTPDEENKGRAVGKMTLETKTAEGKELTSSMKMSDFSMDSESASGIFKQIGPLLAIQLNQDITYTHDDLGNTLDSSQGPPPFTMHLPEKPIKVGESWTVNSTNMAAKKTVTVTGKLLGVERADGRELLRMQLEGLDFIEGAEILKPVVFTFDPATGLAHELTMSMKGVQPGGLTMTMDMLIRKK